MSERGHDVESLQDLLDGRLTPAEQERVRSHLAACPACRAELALLEQGRDAASLLRRDYELPAGLADAVRTALGSDARPTRLTGRRSLVAGLAAALVLSAGMWWARPRRNLVAQAASDFRAVAAGELRPDLSTSDARSLEEHFARAGAPAVRVLDLGMMGFTLLGGGRHELGDHSSALYVYRNVKGDRLVCQMFEGSVAALPAAPDVRQSRGFRFLVFTDLDVTVVFWQEGGIVCALAARLPSEEVVQLAVAKAMEPPAPASIPPGA